MKESIQRAKDLDNILVKISDKEVLINEKDFLKDRKVQGTIRIQKKDYPMINEKKGFITHFNLECSGHKKKEKYRYPFSL